MYLVGVVPGPSKPSLDQINHALRPLVDDLSRFWKPGVFLSRTSEHKEGRHVFAALIPLVCDLLGAKQVAGFSSHNSKYFCTYCLLPIDEIENFNKETWPPCDFEEHKVRAKLWRDAKTVEERDKVFNDFGVRWTELFRLEYWNAILFIVVESMHLLYLGLLATHCREIWGMDVKMLDGDATFSPRTKGVAPRPAPDIMLRASETVLWYLCLDRNINHGKSAKLLAKRLTKWRKKDEVTKYMKDIIREKAGDESAEPEKDAGLPPHVHSASDIDQAIETLNKISPILPSHLLAFNKAVLVNLCVQNSLSKQGNKPELVQHLMKWRAEHGHPGDLSEEPPANLSKAARLETMISSAEAAFSAASAPSSNSLTAYTNDILKALCKRRNIPVSGAKKVLIERLILWKAEGTAGMSAAEAAKNPGAKPALNTAVLGQTVLSEVHKDMTKTELPTWVSRAPSKFGTTEHGKLSADQWRTACTIHLPITLIRLWGNEDGRFKEMLENFIDLIVAVEIGSMLSVSSEHASLYDMLMKRYLDGVNALYKEANFVPNHHISLHLGDFMCSFGPVHAWRAFATERYNYLLQQVNTNQKFGDMELTFMKHACRTANLRPLMEEPQVRDSVFELVEAYEAFQSEDRRGTRIKDTLVFALVQQEARDPLKRPSTLDEVSLQAISEALKDPTTVATIAGINNEKFVPPDVTFYSRIFISGVTYRPSSHFPKDSNVIYCSRDGEIAARIRHIFRSEGQSDQTYIIVQRVCELSDAHAVYDNYRKFLMGTGKLYYNRYEPTVEAITADKIVCHFAKTILHFPEAGGSCMHVLPLQRMMDAVSLPHLDDLVELNDLAELDELPMDVDSI
ncbi:hypothetical protein EWM64_g6562 [Hericium alpestre]|uniref:SAP domain-containing protein n=1 Tax=Hericium alpestre TaxID=135208 RepID=A0A4Y9ZTA7_9AGAM|nr:hypothetical protein EWM64_g6562 [Hericium alpestre]